MTLTWSRRVSSARATSLNRPLGDVGDAVGQLPWMAGIEIIVPGDLAVDVEGVGFTGATPSADRGRVR